MTGKEPQWAMETVVPGGALVNGWPEEDRFATPVVRRRQGSNARDHQRVTSLASLAFIGLDSAEWTALGTVVLAIATFVFVVLTRSMAKAAESSARDSASAAKSAKDSASAAERGNALLLAQLPIDFSVKYQVWVTSLGTVGELMVTCEASTVYFHELRLIGAVGASFDQAESMIDFQSPGPTEEEKREAETGVLLGTRCPQPPADFPAFTPPHLMHKGEMVGLVLPHDALDPRLEPVIEVSILYSLEEDDKVRTIRRLAQAMPNVFGLRSSGD
jgi:hypothetical protein